MIQFQPITPETKETFRKYRSAQLRNCDSAFANIFCWQQTYHSAYAEIGEWLVVKYRVEDRGEDAYMLFARDYSAQNLASIIPILEEDAHANGQRLRITGLPQCAVEVMRPTYGERFAFAGNRDTADYIYNAADLQELQGRKYQPKRNHLNRFNDFYDWSFEPLIPAHKDICLQLENDWQSHHQSDETISAERMAIVRAFDNFESLGLSGGLLRIDGRPAAFTYGSPVNDEVFDIHAEKADTSFEGIFPAINRLFARTLPAQYKYINREEDMGLEGLRRSKMSYHPTLLEYKYTAVALDGDELSIRALWEDVFGDERTFTDKFIAERAMYGVETLVGRVDGAIVAMLHIVPFADDCGNDIAYIYGVATAPQYRNRGFATSLLDEAAERIRNSFDAAVLIPSGSDAKRLYARFGFEDAGIPVTFGTEFDFGSGDSSQDRAMILRLTDKQLPSTLHLVSATKRVPPETIRAEHDIAIVK